MTRRASGKPARTRTAHTYHDAMAVSRQWSTLAMSQWTCSDTVTELRGGQPRVLPVQPRPAGVELTWSDYFCGAGGSSSGIELVPGNTVVMAVNHWRLAIDTHNHNLPHADHDQANVARTDPRRYPRTDCAWFSPECFPAGTTVLTGRGAIPIEDVEVGDLVWTHQLRWRPVTAVMQKRSDTIVLAGYGHTRLEVTAEHPFRARTTARIWDNSVRRYRRVYGQPGWVAAGRLTPVPASNTTGEGHAWASPTDFGQADPPPVRRRGIDFDGDFWWLVGRWLGDGCLRADRGEVQITCGRGEAEDLERRLRAFAPPTADRAQASELRWSRRDIRTATVFSTSHTGLMEWLRYHFGEHASGKRMPAWALGMRRDWREALLDGYMSADGGLVQIPGQRTIQAATTVSRPLAVGVRLLALSLGWKASMGLASSRTEGFIEGRRVKMRPLWRVQWCIDPSPNHDQTHAEDGLRWAPVRGIRPGGSNVLVYNLSVADDESYVADGIVVHNCTFWSVARGDRCDYDTEQMYLDGLEPDEDPAAAESKWRSRMLMRDVVRFTRHHRYRAVIVENVPDILKWANLDRWLREMQLEGYRYKILTLNSAFAQALGPPAPQLRDRVYVIFWQAQYRTPNWDKWMRPYGWCPSCREVVQARYSPKPGPRRPMRYGPRAQYVYRCPNTRCRKAVVRPYALPALAVIDLTDPGQRIGDRKRRLAEATRLRIAAGIVRLRRPLVAEVAGHTFERHPGVRTRPVDQPMATQHTTASKALACPPMVVPAGGARRARGTAGARSAELPLATVTGTESDALVTPPFLTVLRSGRPRTRRLDEPLATVVADGSGHALVQPAAMVVPLEGRDGHHARDVHADPMRTQTGRHLDALVVPLRNNGVARPVDDHPLMTVAARGEHHAFVMRNNTPRGDAGQMSTPVGEPLRTLTTAGHQSLVTVGQHVLYSYDTGLMRPLDEPLPTQTGVEGDALVRAAAEVDDCLLRMLTVKEVKDGTGFDPDVLGHEFVLLGTAKRDQVKMVGNAVTPPTARDLAACVMEAVTGIEIEPGWSS